jgi:hypothetical protein
MGSTASLTICSNWQRTRMSIETSQITVSGLRISIVRKAIKNLHLGVYPAPRPSARGCASGRH